MFLNRGKEVLEMNSFKSAAAILIGILFGMHPHAARALESEDAFGCWSGEKRDGAAVYKLEACAKGICGKVIKAAADGKRPTEADIESQANQNFFSGTRSGKLTWSGQMYIFRFDTKSEVEVEITSKTQLRVGNSIARRNWTRVPCPAA
jgi:hypothetical protein